MPEVSKGLRDFLCVNLQFFTNQHPTKEEIKLKKFVMCTEQGWHLMQAGATYTYLDFSL